MYRTDPELRQSCFRLLAALLIHMGMLLLLQTLFGAGGRYAPALSNVCANAICIPVFLWMLKRLPENSSRTDTVFFRLFSLLLGAGVSLTFGLIMNKTGLDHAFPDMPAEQLKEAPLWLQVAGLSILVPISEELLYRGVVFRVIKSRLPMVVSAVFSSILFALGHGNIIHMLYAFVMGLLLCWCADTGGIGASILFHIGANLAVALGPVMLHNIH